MQEPVKRKPLFAIGIAVTIFIVVAVAIVISYNTFNRSYNNYLDKLKDMISTAGKQFETGDSTAGAALSDEYNFYISLKGQISNLSIVLEKLNGNYPMLLGRGTAESLGIEKLASNMADMSPKLDELKACIDEDASITTQFSELLGKGAVPGLSVEYSGLASRNDLLAVKVSGISFSGAIEGSRAAFAGEIDKRSKALAYLVSDSAITDELDTLLSDVQSQPKDLNDKLNSLLARNDTLMDKAAGVDLKYFGAVDSDIAKTISDRKDRINISIKYMGDLVAVQSGVVAFCTDLSNGAAQGGKYSQKLAAYMGWVTKLKTLEKQLSLINAKKDYADIASKRALANLGMTPEGGTLLSFEPALTAVNSGIATSNDIEKQINALLADNKMSLASKITALEKLLARNLELVSSLAVKVPDDITAGLASFTAGCDERSIFLNEYIGYVEDKTVADTFLTTCNAYLAQRKEYLNTANYYLALDGYKSPNVIYYQGLADDQSTFAGDQKTKYSAAIKSANVHKKAYEASRKKYLALFGS